MRFFPTPRQVLDFPGAVKAPGKKGSEPGDAGFVAEAVGAEAAWAGSSLDWQVFDEQAEGLPGALAADF